MALTLSIIWTCEAALNSYVLMLSVWAVFLEFRLGLPLKKKNHVWMNENVICSNKFGCNPCSLNYVAEFASFISIFLLLKKVTIAYGSVLIGQLHTY